jgi:predicted alpha/beta hydrolase
MFSVKIKTGFGYEISSQVYKGNADGAVLIIAGAMGTKQYYYSKFAEFIAAKGITVITFDYFGIGQSLNIPITKIDATLKDWGANDLEAILNYAIATYPGVEVCVLGHSAGGQLIGLSPSILSINKIILVSAQSGYWKLWNGILKYQMWANWHILFPLLVGIFRYMPSKKISGMENLPAGVARQWQKWCVSPGYLFDDLKEDELHFQKITCRVHAYSSTDDMYAPIAAVDWLTKKFRNALIESTHINPSELGRNKIGHFGFFRPESKNDIWELFYRNLAEDSAVRHIKISDKNE